jgi:hypothetical protein
MVAEANLTEQEFVGGFVGRRNRIPTCGIGRSSVFPKRKRWRAGGWEGAGHYYPGPVIRATDSMPALSPSSYTISEAELVQHIE